MSWTLSIEEPEVEIKSCSLKRDLDDLAQNEVKLRQILSGFGFDKNMETFNVEAIMLIL